MKTEFGNTQLFFTANENEFFVRLNPESVDFLIGIGKESEVSAATYLNVAQKFSNQYRQQFQSIPTSVIGEFSENSFAAFFQGLFLGTYVYPFDKAHPFWKNNFEIHFDGINQEFFNKLSIQTESLCYGQFAAMEWLNKPVNLKTTNSLSFFLGEECRKLNIKYRSLNHAECIKEGMGAYLAVNSASAQEAAFTVLEYHCDKPGTKTVGLVGKCVLFDTGGISIKPSKDMHHMKSDMGGGAAVMGALLAAARLKMPVNIIAVLPITDNVISNKACLPGDVVRACNGKTIEILNTDAEGRLTLADALAYITKNYTTDVLIDLATLTGSVVRMFGEKCAAYFSNNPLLKNRLEASAERTGQKIWNLPLWEDWSEEIKSDVADLKNISLLPNSDCIVAAKFLEQFIDGHTNWAHLDIAGVAFTKVDYMQESAATGYGVRLLLDLIENLTPDTN